MQPSDRTWMKRAIELAEKGRGHTSPNPLVGAVIVKKNKITAEGYHAHFGGPHAELAALQKAGKKSAGATLYVTLEPCVSWGKTPPCVDAVLVSGLRRVVIGTKDPNPENHGRGVQKLKKSGIKVELGILRNEIQNQNAAFFKRMQTGFPYVTLKMAQSLDGKIATRKGASRWISGPASRQFVHRLRSKADAILIGKNTAFIDNPRLGGTNGGIKPWRVVLDPDLRLSPNARVFQGPQLTLIATSENRLKKNAESQQKNRIFIPLPEKNGKLDIKFLLRELASLGVNHLLVEGGGEIAWSLLHQNLVDRLIWIVAPKIIGGREAKTSVEGEGIQEIENAFSLKWEKVYRLDSDWIFEARPSQ